MKKNYPYYETTVFEDFRIMVENVAKKYPNNPAIAYKENPHDEKTIEITYEEAKNDIRDLGTAMVELGCREHHSAIVGASSYGWIYTYFALMAIGSVTVPVDKEMPAADIAGIVETAECEFVFYGIGALEKVNHIRETNKNIKNFVCIDGDPENGDLTLKALIARGHELYEGGDNTYYNYKLDPDKLASIVFTSGTTGSGKGVMLTQTNIVSDMTQGMYLFDIYRNTLNVLPPHHTYGSTVNFVGHYAQGCRIYISNGLKYILKELQEQKPEHLVLVPLFVETFYKRIWSTAEKQGKAKLLRTMMKLAKPFSLSMRRKIFNNAVLKTFGGELKMIICGGAALNQDIIDTFESMGIVILNGYGITECAPLVSCNRNNYRKQGSVGMPIIGEQVKILDPDENGEGEICVKGPNVMIGYYKNPEATAAAFTEDGYFRTGDWGKLDEEGWIFITGRLKNLIILGNGKNVYPEEIENEISRISGVNEVVVYAGVSRNKEKEVIVAEIYPDAEALERHGVTEPQKYFEEEIRKINARMAPYKAVTLVRLRSEEFIKNTSRKITRFSIDKNID